MSVILNDFIVNYKKKILSNDSSLLILCTRKLCGIWVPYGQLRETSQEKWQEKNLSLTLGKLHKCVPVTFLFQTQNL